MIAMRCAGPLIGCMRSPNGSPTSRLFPPTAPRRMLARLPRETAAGAQQAHTARGHRAAFRAGTLALGAFVARKSRCVPGRANTPDYRVHPAARAILSRTLAHTRSCELADLADHR